MRLATHNLSAAVGRRVVVAGVDLEVPSGTTTALVGVNGSGKSTLLRALAGVRPAPQGHVEIDGRRTDRMSSRERARLVALVAQDDPAPEDLLVKEMVALGRTPHVSAWDRGGDTEQRLVQEALERVGLDGFANRPCTQMSGGEQRRALLARGLVQQTPVLLLDEPTNHLDVAQQHRLLRLVESLGRTVVMALHDLDLAHLYADQVVVLHDGRVLAAGPPEQVFARQVVSTAFDVRILQVFEPSTGTRHLVCIPKAQKQSAPSSLTTTAPLTKEKQ